MRGQPTGSGHYAARYKRRIKELEARIDLLLTGLVTLQTYVNSEKFWKDRNVNPSDVDLRINEVKSEFHTLIMDQLNERDS